MVALAWTKRILLHLRGGGDGAEHADLLRGVLRPDAWSLLPRNDHGQAQHQPAHGVTRLREPRQCDRRRGQSHERGGPQNATSLSRIAQVLSWPR